MPMRNQSTSRPVALYLRRQGPYASSPMAISGSSLVALRTNSSSAATSLLRGSSSFAMYSSGVLTLSCPFITCPVESLEHCPTDKIGLGLRSHTHPAHAGNDQIRALGVRAAVRLDRRAARLARRRISHG